VEYADCSEGDVEMARAAAMVTKDAPVLEPGNAMFDTGSATAMLPPGTVAHPPEPACMRAIVLVIRVT